MENLWDEKMCDLWDKYSIDLTDITQRQYKTIINEFMDFIHKPLWKCTDTAVSEYYQQKKKEVESGKMKQSTLYKKFKVLNAFANYIQENTNLNFINEFHPYLYYLKVNTQMDDNRPRNISIENIDSLLRATEHDLLSFTIISTIFYTGLNATEVLDMKFQNLIIDEFGAYLEFVKKGRMQIVYLPENLIIILNQYLDTIAIDSKQPEHYIFQTSKGKVNLRTLEYRIRKYCIQNNIPSTTLQDVRNIAACVMYAYNGDDKNTDIRMASQLNIDIQNAKRYKNRITQNDLLCHANKYVKIKIEPADSL